MKVFWMLIVLLVFTATVPAIAQDSVCSPAAVIASFEAAALSSELESWVRGYEQSDCPDSVKAGVRVLAEGYGILIGSID